MKEKNRLVYFLQEVAIVVIGVLIAVSIGNYKEQVNNEDYIEKTLQAIEKEIKLSQTDLDTVLNRHLELYIALEEEMGNNEQSLGEFVMNSGGFQVATIKNISLRFFVSNKAELLEFSLISQLLEIESLTNTLSDKIKRLTDFAYENVDRNDDEVKLKFAYLVANVIDGEQSLSAAYSNFLEENERNLSGETQ